MCKNSKIFYVRCRECDCSVRVNDIDKYKKTKGKIEYICPVCGRKTKSVIFREIP